MTRPVAGFASAILLALCGTSPLAADEGLDLFEKQIRPIFVDRCEDCHGTEKQKGDLRLDSRIGWMRGGASGAVIVPGKPDDSLLITAVRYWDKNLQMPPKHALEAREVSALIEWVKLGASDPRDTEPTAERSQRVTSFDAERARAHWAFQPVQTAEPPEVRDKTWPWNDVDRFTLAAMERAGVKPAPDADRAILPRRVTFDLTGLPPTPAELEAFLQDRSPGLRPFPRKRRHPRALRSPTRQHERLCLAVPHRSTTGGTRRAFHRAH